MLDPHRNIAKRGGGSEAWLTLSTSPRVQWKGELEDESTTELVRPCCLNSSSAANYGCNVSSIMQRNRSQSDARVSHMLLTRASGMCSTILAHMSHDQLQQVALLEKVGDRIILTDHRQV
jgi:sigma54-dependent transcription regulator